MKGKNILVTGGAGMIGSNLVKRLVKEGCHTRVVDNLWRGKLDHLLENGDPAIDINRDFLNLDLSVPGTLEPHLGDVDWVVHLADIVAGIGFVFGHQGFVFRQNLLINSNVLEACRKAKPAGLLYVGTACSFPAAKQTGVDAPPLREEDQYPAYPESAYGWSKLMGEYESLLLEKETGIPVSVLSLHNVYGSPCDFSASTSQVIPSLIRKALDFPQTPFVVWGSGNQGRAFVHVDDVVDAIVSALENGWNQGVIQVGPNECTPISTIARMIVDVSGKDIPIEFDTGKPEGDRGRCADFSKAQRILGWKPRITMRDGLDRLYEWMLRHNKNEQTAAN